MRITFLTPAPDLSGGQRVVAIHADRLLKLGHEVTVVARGRKPVTLGTRARHFVRGKWLPKPPNETHFDRMDARLVLLPNSVPIAAEMVPDADVVIATWWGTAFEVARLPASKGRKVYFVQHHEVFPHLPAHLSAGSYYLPLQKITISSWLVETMRDLYGDDDVALVPNSVDHELFFAPERRKQPVPTVGLMYAPTPFKGVDIALRAIEIARRTHPDLRVIAFGAHPPTKQLPLPKGAEFHLAPQQTRLREIYSSCDVWLCGSRSEGFHLPPAEAMACRCPIVSTRVGGPMDLVRQGQEGFLVDVEDAKALGARLSEVLSMDDTNWSAMSDAAHRKTLSYTWDDASALFEATLLREFDDRKHHSKRADRMST